MKTCSMAMWNLQFEDNKKNNALFSNQSVHKRNVRKLEFTI